ncbi:MAG: hypothetical protein IIY89_05470 [Clostridia bacterium]|nr:hypothetical protein [Clostridia bacterium]
MKNEVDAKNFQVNAEPFPTGVVWAQIVKATQVMTMMKTSLINGAINPLYRIMQEQQIVFIIIITHYLLICQVNKL